MTAILPRPAAPSIPDAMQPHLALLLDAALADAANLRRQLGAVIDLAVNQEMTPHRNKAEHPAVA